MRHEFVSNGPLTTAAIKSAVEHCGGMGYAMEELVAPWDLIEPAMVLADEHGLALSIVNDLPFDEWRLREAA